MEELYGRRSSDPRRPRAMRQWSQGRRRSVGQGYVQAGILSREITAFGVPTPSKRPGGNIADGGIREPSPDPSASGVPLRTTLSRPGLQFLVPIGAFGLLLLAEDEHKTLHCEPPSVNCLAYPAPVSVSLLDAPSLAASLLPRCRAQAG
jgi:hypothetical protein